MLTDLPCGPLLKKGGCDGLLQAVVVHFIDQGGRDSLMVSGSSTLKTDDLKHHQT